MKNYKDMLEEFKRIKAQEVSSLEDQEQADILKNEDEEKQFQRASMLGGIATDLGKIRNPFERMKGTSASVPDFQATADLIKPQLSKKDILAKYAQLKGGAREDIGKADFSAMNQQGDLEKQQRLFEQQSRLLDTKNSAKSGGVGSLTKGQESLDKSFAKSYESLIPGGGQVKAAASIAELRSLADRVKDMGAASGGFVGMLPKGARDVIGGGDIEDRVLGNIMSTLRETLGSQFTEQEGQKIFNATYNPRATEEENTRRLVNLSKILEKQLQDKVLAANYFEENGTLKGFKAPNNADQLLQEFKTQYSENKDEKNDYGLLTPEAKASVDEVQKLNQEVGDYVTFYNPKAPAGQQQVAIPAEEAAKNKQKLYKMGYIQK